MRPRLTGPETVIAISGALWGLYWIPVRHLEARGVGVVWTTLGLFVVGLALFVPILIRHPPARAAFTPRMLATGLLTGGAFVLYSISIVLTEVVTAILLFYLSPVWATVLGRVLLAERFTGSRLAALALGLGGLWVVLGGESGVPLPRNPGDWCALAAGVAWALGSLRVHQDSAISSVVHVTSLFIGGMAVIVIVSLLPAMSGPAPVVTAQAAALVPCPRAAEHGERVGHPLGRAARQSGPRGAPADDGGDHRARDRRDAGRRAVRPAPDRRIGADSSPRRSSRCCRRPSGAVSDAARADGDGSQAMASSSSATLRAPSSPFTSGSRSSRTAATKSSTSPV